MSMREMDLDSTQPGLFAPPFHEHADVIHSACVMEDVSPHRQKGQYPTVIGRQQNSLSCLIAGQYKFCNEPLAGDDFEHAVRTTDINNVYCKNADSTTQSASHQDARDAIVEKFTGKPVYRYVFSVSGYGAKVKRDRNDVLLLDPSTPGLFTDLQRKFLMRLKDIEYVSLADATVTHLSRVHGVGLTKAKALVRKRDVENTPLNWTIIFGKNKAGYKKPFWITDPQDT
jgi:hypothetical protein